MPFTQSARDREDDTDPGRRGADQLRNRPMIVDAPSGKGRVLLFVNNPIYRWQTFGEHGLVFNALLFWNDLPAAPPPAEATAGRP